MERALSPPSVDALDSRGVAGAGQGGEGWGKRRGERRAAVGAGQLAVEARRRVAATAVLSAAWVCVRVRALALIDASVWTRRGG